MWSYPLCFFSVAEISLFFVYLFIFVYSHFSYSCQHFFLFAHFPPSSWNTFVRNVIFSSTLYCKNVRELSLFAIHMNNWSKLVTLVKILRLPQKKFSGLYSTMNRLLCLLKFARSLSVLDLTANLNDLFVARKTCKSYLIRLRPVFCQHFGNLPHAMWNRQFYVRGARWDLCQRATKVIFTP